MSLLKELLKGAGQFSLGFIGGEPYLNQLYRNQQTERNDRALAYQHANDAYNRNRQMEQDALNRRVTMAQLAKGDREAVNEQSRLDALAATFPYASGQAAGPPTQVNQLAYAAGLDGDMGAALKALAPPKSTYGQPKAAINPATGQKVFVQFDRGGNAREIPGYTPPVTLEQLFAAQALGGGFGAGAVPVGAGSVFDPGTVPDYRVGPGGTLERVK